RPRCRTRAPPGPPRPRPRPPRGPTPPRIPPPRPPQRTASPPPVSVPPVVSPAPAAPAPSMPGLEAVGTNGARTFQGSLGVLEIEELTQAIAVGAKTGRLLLVLNTGSGLVVFEGG